MLREGNSLAFRKRRSESVGIGAMERAYSQPIFGMTATSRNASSVPCSSDAASVQILSNATLMLIVVCDVTVLSHLSTLNIIFTV